MRKVLKALTLTIGAIALCGALAGCEADKAMGTDEDPVKMVYIYSPDGTLLDKGWADKVSSFVHNDRIVRVTINGKAYETSWANVVLVEE